MRKGNPNQNLQRHQALVDYVAKNVQSWPKGIKKYYLLGGQKMRSASPCEHNFPLSGGTSTCTKEQWKQKRLDNSKIDEMLLNGKGKVFYAGWNAFNDIKRKFNINNDLKEIHRAPFIVKLCLSIDTYDIVSKTRKEGSYA